MNPETAKVYVVQSQHPAPATRAQQAPSPAPSYVGQEAAPISIQTLPPPPGLPAQAYSSGYPAAQGTQMFLMPAAEQAPQRAPILIR